MENSVAEKKKKKEEKKSTDRPSNRILKAIPIQVKKLFVYIIQ